MGGTQPINAWVRTLLSLVLLAANVGAPFRSSDLSRTILSSLPLSMATGSVVRVRAVSPSGASLGFRAAVGLSGGGPDTPEWGSRSGSFSALLPSPTVIFPDPHSRPANASLRPPLRC